MYAAYQVGGLMESVDVDMHGWLGDEAPHGIFKVW